MAFNKEIQNYLSPVYDAFSFKYTLIEGVGAYFENVLKICEISTYSVTLSTKKGLYSVCGDGLKIRKYYSGDLAICGNVTRVEKLK